MEVQIDEAGHNGTAGEIEPVGVGRHRGSVGRPDACDAVALNDDTAALDGCAAAAVNHADVVEDEAPRLRRARGDRNQRKPTKYLAHRRRL